MDLIEELSGSDYETDALDHRAGRAPATTPERPLIDLPSLALPEGFS
jgi:hypothetical protein